MSAAVAVAVPAERERRRPGRREILEEEFDPVMPAQWFDAGRAAAMQPEKRLMFAVLSDGVDIVMTARGTTNVRRRMLFHETAAWIRSDDREWPYSFVNLCEALGFEFQCLRAGLARFIDDVPPAPEVEVEVEELLPDACELGKV